MRKNIIIYGLVLILFSCSLFEYDDPSQPLTNSPPETYLALIAGDTIYHVITEIVTTTDTISGQTSYDTLKTYMLGSVPDTLEVLDTLTQAFIDTMTSVQVLNWWGEDVDGSVAGYFYKWDVDADWTYTNHESALFYVPIRSSFDVFSFQVKAVDNSAVWEYESPVLSHTDDELFSDIGDSNYVYDSSDLVLSEGNTAGIQTTPGSRLTHVSGNEIYKLPPTETEGAIDLTPEFIVLPIRNSKPSLSFRYLSNPVVNDIEGDTAFTFPTRTFVWDSFDQDGRESITDLFYAIDSLCDTCWIRLDPAISSLTLTQADLSSGLHTFYLKAVDIAGAESAIIQYPDPDNLGEPPFWKVREVKGDILVVDDFIQDSQNMALTWLAGVMDSVAGPDEYTVWELDSRLPYSTTDLTESLKYFKHVIWNGAYTGAELYDEAETSIYNYVLGGGNFFIAVPNISDTSFVWFPIDSIFTFNSTYRFLMGDRTLHAQVEGAPDLRTDDGQAVYVSMKAFENDPGHPGYTPLYRLPEPIDPLFDEWEGTPTVAGIHDFPNTTGSGKSVLLTIPLHNGYFPLLEGNANSVDFFNYLIYDLFAE